MKILIVDDEETARYGMRKTLTVKGRVFEAGNLAAARKICEGERPELVLLDLNLGGESGLDLLDDLMRQEAPPQVIVITAHGNERVAVEAMQKGAYHYLSKPFDIDELRLLVRNASRQIDLRKENQSLKAELAAVTGYGDMIGSSQAMRRVYQLIDQVAETDVTLLLTGESGSGKELVAREVHRRSQRSEHPMVSVNCAAIPDNLIESELFGHEKGAFTGATQRRIGKFEQADQGTLFLDEVGDMPLDTQAKILRALEEKEVQRLGGNETIGVDVRLISASNKDLKQMVSEREFREDLYYRLVVVQVEVPSLRARRQDVPFLVDYFVGILAERHGRPRPRFNAEALSRLSAYSFPGNVRQLRNIVERLVVLHSKEGAITVEELPEEVRNYLPDSGVDTSGMSLAPFFELEFKPSREEFERKYLLWKLREHKNNITHTAAAIGIHRQSLQQKIKDLDLKEWL